MNSPMLLAKLAEIKNARLLGPQAAEALDPFIGKPFSLSLTFVSASRTFGHRFDAAYDDGQTLICKLGDEGLEASVLLVTEESDLVDSLDPDEAFEARLTVLDFDALYQRPIFGTIPEKTEAPEEPPGVLPVLNFVGWRLMPPTLEARRWGSTQMGV